MRITDNNSFRKVISTILYLIISLQLLLIINCPIKVTGYVYIRNATKVNIRKN